MIILLALTAFPFIQSLIAIFSWHVHSQLVCTKQESGKISSGGIIVNQTRGMLRVLGQKDKGMNPIQGGRERGRARLKDLVSHIMSLRSNAVQRKQANLLNSHAINCIRTGMLAP